MESTKRQEFASYRKLGLDRTHKSEVRRRRLQERGIYAYVGANDSSRPFLKVLRSSYNKTRADVSKKILEDALRLGIAPEQADDLMRQKIEDAAYDALLGESRTLQRIELEFQKRHGRSLTPFEAERFVAVMKTPREAPENPRESAVAEGVEERTRRRWLGDVIQGALRSHVQAPCHLQSAWASVAGTEAAMDTELRYVDYARGLAFCRCLSSTQMHMLKRQSDLASRLGLALGVKINKIVFQ
jgi:hypothetical protein